MRRKFDLQLFAAGSAGVSGTDTVGGSGTDTVGGSVGVKAEGEANVEENTTPSARSASTPPQRGMKEEGKQNGADTVGVTRTDTVGGAAGVSRTDTVGGAAGVSRTDTVGDSVAGAVTWGEFIGKFAPEKFGDAELVSQADVEGFVPVAEELGLSAAAGEKLIAYVQTVNRKKFEEFEAAKTARIEEYNRAVKADKEFSGETGEKFAENLNIANAGMRKLFNNNAEVIKAIVESPLGSHPEMVKACWRIGLMEKEGVTLGQLGSAVGSGGKDPLKEMYNASDHN